ncbi:MAG: hypothetical protein KAR17_15445 [Cyclobacteriaceae bacterium]|nr:hypothetical protein [Cyclobacteriaceae bacterium]
MIDQFKFPLEIAINEINKQREILQQYEKEDVGACKCYLDIAKSAVAGLGKEPQDIILHARKVNINDQEDVQILKDRIDKYLFSDNLRLPLRDALSGLEGIKKALENHAKRRLQWPGVKKNRTDTLKKFEGLLPKLFYFIQNLDQFYPQGGSGMLLDDLHKIRSYLKSEKPSETLKQEITIYLEQTEINRSKIYKHWLDMYGDFTRTFELLRTSFR